MYLIAASHAGNPVTGGFELLALIAFVAFLIWCFKK